MSLAGSVACHAEKGQYEELGNKNIKMNAFKSRIARKNIQKKEVGPDISVLNDKFSSVTLNELAMKPIKTV